MTGQVPLAGSRRALLGDILGGIRLNRGLRPLGVRRAVKLIKKGEELSLKVDALTQELKIELKKTKGYLLKKLELIDTIQRLSIGYLFEEDIDQALQNLFDNHLDFYKSNNDLYSIAISFRLLRQHGHKVSCEIFEKFKDEKGEFEASLTSDFMGMLEFYEATYLSIHGEDVLDHGRVFTRSHLRSILPNISSSSIREQVFHVLDYSYLRELLRLAARNYISIYEQRASRHEKLLQLAKLDFNRLQILYKRELSEFFGILLLGLIFQMLLNFSISCTYGSQLKF